MNNIFYKPSDGWVGDAIPYYDGKAYRIYFLYDKRENGEYGNHTSWNLVTTKDGLNFKDYGTSLPHGFDHEKDKNAYTGSVIQAKDGLYYLFYTGHNQAEAFCENSIPLQVILRAISKDGVNWEKDSEFSLYGKEPYQKYDWRDPFVFYNEQEKQYWMLVTAALSGQAEKRGGCIALLKSKDLEEWFYCAPFYTPEKYITMECSDLFKMGDWYYLVYSTFNERFVTHYRKSKSIGGPYCSTPFDTFDARGFYAAKTASDGEKRYAFGWVPSKLGRNDFGPWEWGGTLVVHEIYQDDNGDLLTCMPSAISDAFVNIESVEFISGQYETLGESIQLYSDNGFAYFVCNELNQQQMIEADFSEFSKIRNFGIAIHTDEKMEKGYFLRFEPFYNRIVFDMWPRERTGEFQWQISGDKPQIIELERPFDYSLCDRIHVRILIENDILCAYFNDRVAMTTRIYNHTHGKLGFFADEGSVKICNIKLLHR